VVLKDWPLLRLLFQKQLELFKNFIVGAFEFALVDEDMHLDIVRYEVSKGGFLNHLVVNSI
jgi:hypothetical protein